jgi:hypothetical protein
MDLIIIILIVLTIDLASVWLYRKGGIANGLFITWATFFHGIAAYVIAVCLGVPYNHPVSLYLVLPGSLVGFQSAKVVVKISKLEKRL